MLFNHTINLMARKPLLANIDASVLEAHMHCRTEWPIGLVEAITKAKQTTIDVWLSDNVLYAPQTNTTPEFNINFKY